jgi:predicted DNA-binding transcriptional regulator YafY
MKIDRTKSQFARLMALDAEIRDGKYPNCLTFSADWEVSQKTIQRDIDYLRYQLGAPIEYDREKKGFYYSNDTWFLPSLSVNEGDLFALLVGSKALEAYRGTPVAEHLHDVFGKLAGMLTDRISLSPEMVFTRFTFRGPPSRQIDRQIWTVLVRGLLHQRSVRVAYRSRGSKAATERIIDPYHAANLAGEWYVIVWDHKSGKILQLAMAHIHEAKLLDNKFSIIENFDPEELLSKTFNRYVSDRDAKRIRLLFDKEAADWVLERQWHPEQKIKKRRNGDIELSFETPGVWEVFRWVLSWGPYVKVLAPSELKKWVQEDVRKMAEKYGYLEKGEHYE